MTSRKIIWLLLLVLVVVACISLLRFKPSSPVPKTVSTPEVQSQKNTGTFVDSLIGQFVYLNQGKFYQVNLPTRKIVQLSGADDKLVATFPSVRPVWSSDGNQFAFLLDEKTLIVNEFLSGKLLARIEMDKKVDLSKDKIELSFSPDDTTLLLKINTEKDDSTLRFFSLETKKMIGEWQNCRVAGAWMFKNSSYAVSCVKDGKTEILLLHPRGMMVEAREVGSANAYELLNVFDSVSLLVKKGAKAGQLMLDGKFRAIEAKQFENLASLDAFVNLERALADKIEQEKKTEKIDDLVVAPSNTFALFHTEKGIWVIDLPKLSFPYFLFAGELPSVRP